MQPDREDAPEIDPLTGDVQPTSEPADDEIRSLVDEMKITLDKLVRDKASRGDVKLVQTALAELRYAFKVFGKLKGRRKVSVFGSARTPVDDPNYLLAEEFGRKIAALGYMVITGAACGIMEAGHQGAGREASIGLNIMLPFEQKSNPVIFGDDKLMHMKYFFTRKLLFIKESDAIVLFPGGFGTHDEGFEALTLVQTGKSHLFPLVLVAAPGDDYWVKWVEFVEGVLVPRRMVSPEDVALFKLCHTADEAAEEIQTFYRVYHSSRYVKRDLVLRMQKSLPESLMADIRVEFKDICVSGTFEQTAALPLEKNEGHLSHLPRLVFRFDRHHHARLRQLIDRINQS